MTDEERRKLCRDLRRMLAFKTLCTDAAYEIERLAAENGRLTQALIDKIAEPKFREVERPPFVIKEPS